MIVLGNEKSLLGWFFMWYLPLFLGGIIAGYFAHDKGWISGFIIAMIWASSSVFTDLSGKTPMIFVLWHTMGLPVGAASGYFGQFLARMISAKMQRKITAVIVGSFVAFALSMILICLFGNVGKTCSYNGGQFWLKDLINNCLPLLIGGIFAGIIAQRHGWVCAFLSWLFFQAFTIVILLMIGLGKPIISSFATYEWSFIARTMSRLISTLIPAWWLYAISLFSAVIGGYLGQLLVQKYHKRIHS